jgi:HSP20 family protein
MAKKKDNVEIKKSDDRKRTLQYRDDEYFQPRDMVRRMDEEFDIFRRNLTRNLMLPRFRLLSDYDRYPERYISEGMGTTIQMPLMDIRDTGKEYIVEAELPGIPKKNIDINVTKDLLEIKGENKMEIQDDKDDYYRRERSYAGFYRQMPLPDDVVPDKADAKFKDGILEITLPKEKPSLKEKAKKLLIK